MKTKIKYTLLSLLFWGIGVCLAYITGMVDAMNHPYIRKETWRWTFIFSHHGLGYAYCNNVYWLFFIVGIPFIIPAMILYYQIFET